MPADLYEQRERPCVRGTRLAPIPIWKDSRHYLYCASVIGLALPFHRRFLRLRPEWKPTCAAIDDAFDLIWTRCASGREPAVAERLRTAHSLRAVAPVDEEGMPLPIADVVATFDLCWVLGELLDPVDLEWHEVARAAARGVRCLVEQELIRTMSRDWRDAPPNPDPSDHPAGLVLESFLREAAARLDAEALVPRFVEELRNEGLSTGDQVFRLLFTAKSEDWLSRWGLVDRHGSRAELS